jgi:hypothetical protein
VELVKECRRHSQHDGAADLAEIGGVHDAPSGKGYIKI